MNNFFGIFFIFAFLVSNINCGGPVAGPCASIHAIIDSLSSYPFNQFAASSDKYNSAYYLLSGSWSGSNFLPSDISAQQQIIQMFSTNPMGTYDCIYSKYESL